MMIMSLDAEYNQPSHKCIEIGAVIYDVKSGKLIDRFQTYVNPNEPIDLEITTLTGIRNSDVTNAPNIAEAFKALEKFYRSHKVFRNPLVWGSGFGFGYGDDSTALWVESGTKEENFMGHRVLDVKTIFQSMQIFKNKEFGCSLEKVCNEVLGIGFEGRSHTALADAMNTFRAWHHLIK